MTKTDRRGDRQYAALPYRIAENGAIEILLVTSRERRRWVVPKGWPMKGRKPRKVVEVEAREEAGIAGIVRRTPIGSYHYSKDMPDGEARLLVVDVYPMLVSSELEHWPEAGERTRRWFHLDDASASVSDGGLALIIDALGSVQPPLIGKSDV